MSREKNINQDDNLTERIYVRLSKKDLRNFKYLAEKECMSMASLSRRIILLYMKSEGVNNEF